MTNQRIIITGGAGFIGANLVHDLHEGGGPMPELGHPTDTPISS